MTETWRVVDLFSGAGGMSFGFHASPGFELVGAADAQIGKPSSGEGTLECNRTYAANMGLSPVEVDLGQVDPGDLRKRMGLTGDVPVLLSCAPCTGYSRANPENHLRDDERNSLVARTAEFSAEFRPRIILLENARELVTGNNNRHLEKLTSALRRQGYQVAAEVHFLNKFGLPQIRERALVVAVTKDLPLLTMSDLWSGYRVNSKATHVRRAIWDLPPVESGCAHPEDAWHVSPSMRTDVRRRLHETPHDGGSWVDLIGHPEMETLLIPSMLRRARINDLGSYPDVYGRMWWDRPAPTIKRECTHVGNGRYAHPEQDRQCTVRELGILNGFPKTYAFAGGMSSAYRHIGDAVPPLISYQLAALVRWILTGVRPEPAQLVLPDTHLTVDDIETAEA